MQSVTRHCAIEGCDRRPEKNGLCYAHYGRKRRYGDALAGGALQTRWGVATRHLFNVVLRHAEDACLPWPFSQSHGRAMIRLDGRMRIVARVVCEAEHGPPPFERAHAAHRCGREWCVARAHLSWKTAADNLADKFGHGTASAKLTVEQAAEILALRGREPQKSIAARFGVAQSTVGGIHSGKSWRQLHGATP